MLKRSKHHFLSATFFLAIPSPIRSVAQETVSNNASNYKTQDFIIGIMGGLIASAIVYFWANIWKKIIIPWYQELFYQDARINGKWKTTFKFQGDINEEIVEIQSRGHQIKGKIIVIVGKRVGKTFEFTGNFRNLILVGTYHATSNMNLDRGTFTLLLKSNGNILDGICALYRGASNTIDHAEYCWQRMDN